jgi:hypothetical protein
MADEGGGAPAPASGMTTYDSIAPAVPGGRGMPAPKPVFRKPKKNPRKKKR